MQTRKRFIIKTCPACVPRQGNNCLLSETEINKLIFSYWLIFFVSLNNKAILKSFKPNDKKNWQAMSFMLCRLWCKVTTKNIKKTTF